MFCSCSEWERMSAQHYISLLLHLEEATMESGPGISDVPDWLETHRRKWPDVYFQVRRERSRGYSPLRSHLDTVSRKARQPGLICSTKWINKGWLCGQVSSDHLPTLKLICTGNDPQHLTSTPGERRGCPGESDHVTLPHLQKRNSPLTSVNCSSVILQQQLIPHTQ